VAGTFGFGWQLAGADANITSNVTPTGSESSGLFTPLRAGSRVYLTLPDGRRVGFTFTPIAHVQPGIDAHDICSVGLNAS
jgi:hypothetical protein